MYSPLAPPALPLLPPLSLAMLAPLTPLVWGTSQSSPKRGCTKPPATRGGAGFLGGAHASASSPKRTGAAGTGALAALLGRGLGAPSPRSWSVQRSSIIAMYSKIDGSLASSASSPNRGIYSGAPVSGAPSSSS